MDSDDVCDVSYGSQLMTRHMLILPIIALECIVQMFQLCPTL